MDYIPNTDTQLQGMLESCGVGEFDELLANIPPEVRCRSFDVPGGLTETEVLSHGEAMCAPNRSLREVISFLGAGAYDHVIPTVVDSLAARGEWLTPYTPYQAEASQGTLQMMYEFQTLICDLMGMEAANASLYDGASSLAEAVVLALRRGQRRRVLISEAVHPHARQVVGTYLSGFPCVIQEIPSTNGVTDLEALAAALKDDVAAVVLQQPNFFGALEPMEQASALTHRFGSLFVASVYPVSLGVLRPPGSYGADIAVAEGRCLGSPIAYGGPGLGLFSTTGELVRKMPGRLSGRTVDQQGRRGFTLTLQTREQHIRRERATSNICTNEGWLCVRAAIFLSVLGPQGLRELAQVNVQKSHDFFDRLVATGVYQPAFEQEYFNERTLRWTGSGTAADAQRALVKAGIVGGVSLGSWYPAMTEASVWCVTDTMSRAQMDHALEVLQAL